MSFAGRLGHSLVVVILVGTALWAVAGWIREWLRRRAARVDQLERFRISHES